MRVTVKRKRQLLFHALCSYSPSRYVTNLVVVALKVVLHDHLFVPLLCAFAALIDLEELNFELETVRRVSYCSAQCDG